MEKGRPVVVRASANNRAAATAILSDTRHRTFMISTSSATLRRTRPLHDERGSTSSHHGCMPIVGAPGHARSAGRLFIPAPFECARKQPERFSSDAPTTSAPCETSSATREPGERLIEEWRSPATSTGPRTVPGDSAVSAAECEVQRTVAA